MSDHLSQTDDDRLAQRVPSKDGLLGGTAASVSIVAAMNELFINTNSSYPVVVSGVKLPIIMLYVIYLQVVLTLPLFLPPFLIFFCWGEGCSVRRGCVSLGRIGFVYQSVVCVCACLRVSFCVCCMFVSVWLW